MSDFSTSALRSKSYVFDPRPRFPFRIAVKRYWVEDCLGAVDRRPASKNRGDAFTLILMHGNGAHKEQWEPTIQRLFQIQQATSRRTVRFHDMWSVDIPNQGDSGILNEEVLRWGYDTFAWENYTRAVHALLAGLGTGVDVDFSKRKLALVGHSLGANAALSMTTYHPLLKISSIHAFEPFLLGEKAENWGLNYEKFADKRKDVWPSPEEAFRSLEARRTVRSWDQRILRILVEHGLRPLPTAEYPDLKKGVTLKCTRKQEAATFRDRVSHGIAYRYLPHVLKEVPTHITYGTLTDFIPKEWQEDVLHNASGGISKFASVSRIPGAGHMVLQSHPDAIADVIWKSLTKSREKHTEDAVVAKL